MTTKPRALSAYNERALIKLRERVRALRLDVSTPAKRRRFMDLLRFIERAEAGEFEDVFFSYLGANLHGE